MGQSLQTKTEELEKVMRYLKERLVEQENRQRCYNQRLKLFKESQNEKSEDLK